MNSYDFIIIGSGLGGLECALTLSREGFHVCVLEKNLLFGGCFQSFKRYGHLLDTGIHYVGSLDEGRILRRYFDYFGIMDKVRMRRLDTAAFDVVNYGGHEYHFAMGHDRFVETLAAAFPKERENLRRYSGMLKQVGDLINPGHLPEGRFSGGGMEYFSQSAAGQIESVIQDPALQNILAGTALLYGGVKDMSTFYHHAMINNSYIEGAYRFEDGSMHVTDALVEKIRQQGGTVRNRAEVTRLIMENGRLKAVEVNGEEILEAKNYISNIHPRRTFELLDKTQQIKKAYISRINSLQNSYGVITAYLIMKKDSYPYVNRNYYFHAHQDVWYDTSFPEDRRISSCLMTMQPLSTSEFADVVTLISPMYMSELQQWEDTGIGKRGPDYESYKTMKGDLLVDFAEQYMPGLKDKIERIHVTTPLTYRDYTATSEGSAYGIIKNYKSPLTTLIPVRTKVENLYLTGQNLNVHGVLGVTLTAMLTCAEFLGTEYLAKKIGDNIQ